MKLRQIFFTMHILFFPLFLFSCSAKQKTDNTSPKNLVEIRVLATTDLHGWLLPIKDDESDTYEGGLAYMAGKFEGREKYNADDFLLLDAGDLWTGPPASTLLKGKPVVDIYNYLKYDAVSIGNHEFDFGQDILETRYKECKFPLLAANVFYEANNQRPIYAKPYVILNYKGIKVGILGFANPETPKTTTLTNITGLKFTAISPLIKEFVPLIRKDGADVLIILTHTSTEEIGKILQEFGPLNIPLVIGGHDHIKESRRIDYGTDTPTDDTLLVSPGPFGRSYASIYLTFDRAGKVVTNHHAEIIELQGKLSSPEFPPNPTLESLIAEVIQPTETDTNEVIAESENGVRIGNFAHSPLGNLLTDAWLESFPEADFAISNLGGLRQPLRAGKITLGDVIGVLPFDNTLYMVSISGQDLKDELTNNYPVVGGMKYVWQTLQNGSRKIQKIFDRNGKEILNTSKYKVVTTNFLYLGGDNFKFKEKDTAPQKTGINWRDPLIAKIRKIKDQSKSVDFIPDVRAIEAQEY